MLIYIITQLVGVFLFISCAEWHFAIKEPWREPINIFSIHVIKSNKIPKIIKILIWLTTIVLFHCMFILYLLFLTVDTLIKKLSKKTINGIN